MIIELRSVPLDKLNGSPPMLHWRSAYAPGWRAVLAQLGVPCPVIVNGRNGRILSPPHMIIALQGLKAERARPPVGIEVSNGAWHVPAVIGYWDEIEEARLSVILAGGIDHTLSPGIKDTSAVELLMNLTQRSLQARDMRYVESVGVDLETLGELLEELAADEPPPKPMPVLDPDLWDIPMLDLARQPTEVVFPVVKYGSRAITEEIDGMLHFYTQDKRFAALTKDPRAVLATRCKAAIEPNFSTSAVMPAAVALHRIYQKRVIATTWQRGGLPVMVDMNVDRRFLEMNLMGVPPGWRAYANRAYLRDFDHLLEAYELACARRGSRDVLYLVYGSGKKARELCLKHGWIWIPEQSDIARGRYTWDGQPISN